MMSEMCKTMMGNQQMIDMIPKMKGENKGMNKIEGMNTMNEWIIIYKR